MYYTELFLATAGGLSHHAEIVLTEVITSTTYIYVLVTFPDLTVTQLTPGEVITLVL